MGSSQRDELVDQAIQKLLSEIETLEKLESSGNSPIQAHNNNHRHLLYSKLLSELESLKQDSMCIQHKPLSEEDGEVSIIKAGEEEYENNKNPDDKDGHGPCRSNEAVGAEEIVKELRVVKRQNFVTHCLLSVVVVLTVAFQLSEVSLIMKVKDGLSHPFRFVGNLLFGNLRGPGSIISQDAEKQQASAKHRLSLLEVVPSVPPLKIPELPHVEFGHTGRNGSTLVLFMEPPAARGQVTETWNLQDDGIYHEQAIRNTFPSYVFRFKQFKNPPVAIMFVNSCWRV